MVPKAIHAPGWRRRLITLAVLAAVVSPALRNHDSFPLSRYPIYAGKRSDVATVNTAIGIDTSGTTHRLGLHAIANTDDPLIAETLVERAIRRGEADALCTRIARRVGGAMAVVEVVAETLDVVAQTAGKPSIVSRTRHARCPVTRP